MVEMALIAPLFILLVFGLIEFGLLFRERLTIASATSSAARTAATLGTQEDADWRILQALEAGLYDQVDTSVLISVDIFLADEDSGAEAGPKNTYVYNPATSCKWVPCLDPALGPPDYTGQTYAPSTRDTSLDPSGGGLDVLGVKVVYQHNTATNLLPFLNTQLTERALVRLEPDVFGTSTP
jgi:hypothetical protein